MLPHLLVPILAQKRLKMVPHTRLWITIKKTTISFCSHNTARPTNKLRHWAQKTKKKKSCAPNLFGFGKKNACCILLVRFFVLKKCLWTMFVWQSSEWSATDTTTSLVYKNHIRGSWCRHCQQQNTLFCLIQFAQFSLDNQQFVTRSFLSWWSSFEWGKQFFGHNI